MNAKFDHSYRKAETGKLVYVYQVSGSAAEIESYKATQGENLVVDEKSGKPLWFTTNYALPQAKLIITSAGKVIADMSSMQQAASLIAQFPGPLGDAIARIAAEQALGKATIAPAPVPAEATPEPATEAGDID